VLPRNALYRIRGIAGETPRQFRLPPGREVKLQAHAGSKAAFGVGLTAALLGFLAALPAGVAVLVLGAVKGDSGFTIAGGVTLGASVALGAGGLVLDFGPGRAKVYTEDGTRIAQSTSAPRVRFTASRLVFTF
jgi:hypothetical protein